MRVRDWIFNGKPKIGDLVRDLLFVFQGIDGAFLTYSPDSEAFLLRKDVSLILLIR